MTDTDTFDRLTAVTNDLLIKHRELGELVAAEKEGRVRGYFEADETSVSAREKVADFQVLDLTTDIIRLKADIAALEVEWKYLMAVFEREL